MQRLTPEEFLDSLNYTKTVTYPDSKTIEPTFQRITTATLMQAYATHVEETAWISVDERLPDDNTPVLGEDSDGEVFRCYLNKNSKWHEDVVHYDCSCDWNHGGSDSEIYKPVVRWQALPTPPKQ